MSISIFNLCPACGSKKIQFVPPKKYICAACGFYLYRNTAATASIVIAVENKLLLVSRGREPQSGMLDIVGGFVDDGETLEEAAVRECREELAFELTPDRLTYLTSYPNVYRYKNIDYTTCDAFFTAVLSPAEYDKVKTDDDEIAGVGLYAGSDVPLEEVAFDSIRRVITFFLKRQFT